MTLFLYKINIFKSYISDAVRDDEIENWAAKKIQSSFKQYKYQKTLGGGRKESASVIVRGENGSSRGAGGETLRKKSSSPT